MTDAVKAPVDMDVERIKFEAAYLAVFNKATNLDKGAAYLAGLRDGDTYGDRPYLNGMWDGWKACLAEEKTFTLAQLRAAVMLWEMDVRANRSDFVGDDEAREIPIEELTDRYVDAIVGYIEKAASNECAASAPAPLPGHEPVQITRIAAMECLTWMEHLRDNGAFKRLLADDASFVRHAFRELDKALKEKA